MADAAMVPVPGAPGGFGGPADFEAALKYAATQADQLQDDPNFYTWLEDWIGKQDEETVMLDAFNTLNDYNMQFEFQQQQQQQASQPKQGVQQPGAGLQGSGTSPSGAQDAAAAAAPVLATHGPEAGPFATAAGPHLPTGVSSSCASMASHPSSQRSEDSSTLPIIGSPTDSTNNSSSRPAPLASPCSSKQPSGAAANPTAPPATTGWFSSLLGGGGLDAGNGAVAAATSRRDAASFSAQANSGSAAAGALGGGGLGALLADPAILFARAAAASGADLNLSALGLDQDVSMDRLPSHGTVSSFVGTPLGVPAAPAFAPAPAPAPPAAAAAALPQQPAAAAHGGGAGRTRASLLLGTGVPSLEALIARAITGNGSNSGIRGGGAGGPSASGLPLNRHGSGSGGAAAAHVEALASLGSSGEYEARRSSGSCGEGGESLPAGHNAGSRRRKAGAAGAHAANPQGAGQVGSALAALHHQHLHQLHHTLHGGVMPGSHHHAHGGKVLAGAGPAAAASCWPRGAGVNASGRPTRSARTKAVFAALEAEVAGKLGELEALRQEHTTLTQRVEILEVAVQRQNAVLSLMGGGGAARRAGGAGAGGAAAASGGSVAAAPPAPAAALAAAGLRGFGAGLGGFGGGGGAGPWGASDPFGALTSGPEGAQLVEWARTCSVEAYKESYKEHLQKLSLALLALDTNPSPETEANLVQLVASGCIRTSLVCVFQPLVQLRLKGLNLETGEYAEPSDAHWMEVIKFMLVGPAQVAEMESLFHSYTLLHGSIRAELQDTQAELAELVAGQDAATRRDLCSRDSLAFVMKQTALLKRVRSILQKTHLLYSCTIGVAAMRILKPKEYAKCCVQSYPYFPCGPSLMKACAQFRAMKMIFGVNLCCP